MSTQGQVSIGYSPLLHNLKNQSKFTVFTSGPNTGVLMRTGRGQFSLPKPALPESQEEILIEVTGKESPSGSLKSHKSQASSSGYCIHDPAAVKSRLPVSAPRLGRLL